MFEKSWEVPILPGYWNPSFGSISHHVIQTRPWRHCFSTVDPWGTWRSTVSAHYPEPVSNAHYYTKPVNGLLICKRRVWCFLSATRGCSTCTCCSERYEFSVLYCYGPAAGMLAPWTLCWASSFLFTFSASHSQISVVDMYMPNDPLKV
jgi:hypothetical protein